MSYETRRKEKNRAIKFYLLILFVIFVGLPSAVGVLIYTHVVQFKFVGTTKNTGEIEPSLALRISIPLLVFFLVMYYLFNKKQNHHLVNYRPILLCKMSAVCSSIYSVCLPILLSYSQHFFGNYRHVVALGFTLIFAPMTMLANLSRYVKLFLLNRRDIGRIRLYDDRNKSAFPGKSSNFEPNDYLKRLNKLVSRQITLTLFVAPYLVLLTWGIVILMFQRKNKNDNSLVTFSPIIFITMVTGLITPYIFVKLYRSLNLVNKLDIILNFFSIFVASVLFVLTLFEINGKVGLTQVKSSSLFFVIPTFFTFFTAVCIPLIEVFISDRKLKDKKLLNKKEFTKLLLGSRYIDSLKSTAVKCYCVETVLFWDMHLKLMKLVNELVNRKDHQSDASSDDKVIDIKQSGLSCNNISSPIPNSYDLLLGLNKNIFGNENNAILYAGCNSNSHDLVQLTSGRPAIDPRLAYPDELSSSPTRDRNFTLTGSGSISSTRSRGFSIDQMSSSYGTYGTYGSYSSNHGSNDLRPSVTLTNGNGTGNGNGSISRNGTGNGSINRNGNGNGNGNNPIIPPKPNNPYNNGKSFYSRQRNDSGLSQYSSSINSYSNQGFMDSANSEKVGLLYHSEPLDLTRSRTLEKTYSGLSYSNASSTTLVNQGTGGRQGPNHVRNNSLKNSNTEIYYELFHVDPEHVELPPELWNDFKNLYYSFISDRSMATVNLDIDTVNRIKKSLNSRNFTIDMFFPAISETVDLMYQNLYPKLLMK